jgi:photosystem II stability/assembly factor-like uncharacterized protein
MLSVVFMLVASCALPGWGSASAAEYWWQNTGPEGGTVAALAIDPAAPATLYAATSDGRLFRTSNGGESWTKIYSGPSFLVPRMGHINAIIVDPTHSSTIYVGSSQGIFKSLTYGITWSSASAGLTSTYISDLDIDPTDPSTLYAAGYGVVFKSTNAGASWTAMNAGLRPPPTPPIPGIRTSDIVALAIDPTDPATLYVSMMGGLFKSTNAGASWIRLSGLPDILHPFALDPVTGGTLYVGTGTGILKSTNGGTTWTDASAGLITGSVVGLAIDPATPTTLYAGISPRGIFKSTDAGASWTPMSSGLTAAYVTSFVFDPTNSSRLYAGTRDGGILKTNDAGANWTAMNSGIMATVIATLVVDPADPATMYAGGWSSGVYGTIDGGRSWTQKNTALPEVGPVHVSALVLDPTAATLYAAASTGIFKSVNGGDAWTSIYAFEYGGPVTALAIDPTAPATLYAGTWRDGIIKTINGGDTWSAVFPGVDVQAMAIDSANPPTVYAAVSGNSAASSGIFRSADAGVTWVSVNIGLTTTAVYGLTIDPTAPTTIYAWTMSGVFKTTDGGATWIPTSFLDYSAYVAIHPTSGTLYVVTNNLYEYDLPRWISSIFKSTDGGASWSAVTGGGEHDVYVSTLAFDPNDPEVLYTGTERGVYIRRENAPPAAPTSRTQRQADGTTAIPVGGWATASTVVFQGTTNDPNTGQPARLQVEVKPVGTAFTGAVSCESPFSVPSGIPPTCSVSGLVPATAYHWRIRSVDIQGGIGRWASYGGNPETAADFIVNRPPAVPTGRSQRQADGVTPIGLGGTAQSATVVFRATVTDPDPGQKVRLQVEVQPLGMSFTGAVHCQSVLVSSGTATTCAVHGLAAATGYHWRLRAVDSRGIPSPLASYATNAETAADFVVAATPAPARPTALAQRQAEGVAPIPLGGATGTTVVFAGTVPLAAPGTTLRFQVEVRPVGLGFTGAPTCQSAPVAPGTAATCPASLAHAVSYHWRARAVDGAGIPGPWVAYGGNPEMAPDFWAWELSD